MSSFRSDLRGTSTPAHRGILQLYEENFFAQPRELRHIKNALAAKGINEHWPEIHSALKELMSKGKLRYTDEKGKRVVNYNSPPGTLPASPEPPPVEWDQGTWLRPSAPKGPQEDIIQAILSLVAEGWLNMRRGRMEVHARCRLMVETKRQQTRSALGAISREEIGEAMLYINRTYGLVEILAAGNAVEYKAPINAQTQLEQMGLLKEQRGEKKKP